MLLKASLSAEKANDTLQMFPACNFAYLPVLMILMAVVILTLSHSTAVREDYCEGKKKPFCLMSGTFFEPSNFLIVKDGKK